MKSNPTETHFKEVNNMSVTLENIDTIIGRTGVSYKVAKETLEATNGDVVEAIVRIEQTKTNREEESKATREKAFEEKKDTVMLQLKWLGKQIMKVANKLMVIKVQWKKEDHVYLQLPALVVLLVGLWTLPVSIFVLLAPLLFGIKMEIVRQSGKTTDVVDWVKEHTPKSEE